MGYYVHSTVLYLYGYLLGFDPEVHLVMVLVELCPRFDLYYRVVHLAADNLLLTLK